MSERQMEAVIVVGAGILLVAIIAFIFMFGAWGLAGTLWRLLGLAVLGGALCLAWRNRRKIAAHMEKRRKGAAARAVAAAAAMAAAEARKPRPLRGGFPSSITFLGPGSSLELDRGRIDDPLVYVVAGGVGETSEPSLIGSNLIAAPPMGRCDEPLPYWPNYRSATPAQRSVYIHWLTSGRKQLPPEIGYAFMFFYGLERRALIDRSDLQVVVDEVIRLRKLNMKSQRPNRSFDSYTGSFLWFLAAAFANKLEAATIKAIAQSTRTWSEENLSAALGWCVQTARGMPAWLAIEIAGQLPGSQRSVVIDRVGEQFRELFAKRYSENHAEGLAVKSSRRGRVYQYKAASAALGTVQFSDGPNPLGLTSQFKPLSDLWNSCVEDLRRLSSVVKRDGQEQLTPAAWQALPEEIRSGTEHPLTSEVCRLVQECTDEEGRTVIQVPHLAALLRLAQKERYTPTESAQIASVVEGVGYCLEPDARLTRRAYKRDEVLTAFLRMTDLQTTTARYAAAACMLRFGMVVASADGQVHPDELTVLLQDLDQMFELNDHERRRLGALRTLITATGPDLASLSQMAKLLKPEQREAIGKLLLVLAAKDGEVTKEEVQAIRKCYKRLGFAQAEIGLALNALRAYQSGEEPVTIRPEAAAVAGEAIPRPAAEKVLRLNRAAIAQIMADTREVAQMLAEAMNAGEQPGQAPFGTPFVPPYATAAASGLAPPQSWQSQAVLVQPDSAAGATAKPTLPARYASFYHLLVSKQEWDLSEVDGLARQQGLMLSGAIDALNEWAAEEYGGQLFIEDGARLYVERTYLS